MKWTMLTALAILTLTGPASAETTAACNSRCQKSVDTCPAKNATGADRAADERSHVACFKGCETAKKAVAK